MSLANPTELLEAPELAVLALLDETLQQAVYALFAAHPELVSGDSLEYCPHLVAEAWLADAIYNQANALQYAIERYREAVARAATIRNASFGDTIE